ncbi:MAG TPA: IS481 family transposase [Kofleriaceae bacterium]|nr:IS481 family transposase [Kofleriaceae bacterium]
MKLHANARTCPNSRQVMVRRFLAGRSREIVAAEFGVSTRTVSKWVARYRAEGEPGLADRSSAPRRVRRTDPDRVEAIAALRRLRFSGPEIAELLGLPLSTTSAVLKRLGMARLGRIGLEAAHRYERERPGELIHIDIKKLGRIQGGAGKRATGHKHYTPRRTDAAGRRAGSAGWDFVHVAVDDATRLAYAEVLPDERATSAIAFLRRAIAWFSSHGITVERVLTDNGSAYVSTMHALACRALGVRHLRTRPRRPQTNGKAERFIRTMLGGWAYSGATYGSSAERRAALDGWLHRYNHHRPHRSLGRQPPIQRLNNLHGTYT